MKKRVNLLCVIISMFILSIFVSGCGFGKTTSSDSDSDKEKSSQVELRFIVNNDDPYLMEAIKAFEQENPNIKVNIETIPWQQFFEKVETMIAGGRTPDLLYTPVLATQRYAKLDLLLDISDSLTDEELKDFVPSTLVSVKHKDGIYGLPHFTDDIAIFYNKDQFAKAGVEVPTSIEETWTWDEFLVAAEKVKKANNLKYGVATGSDVSQWLPFLYQNKGTVLNDYQTSADINSEAGIEAISWFKSWFDKELAPKAAFMGSEKGEELFKQGQVPMVITFSGLISDMNNNIKDFKYGVTYMPKKEVIANKLGGWNIVAFKDTKHPKEATKLIKFLTNTEQMAKFASSKGVVPTRKSAQEIVDYGPMAEGMEVIIEEVNSVPEFAVDDFSIPEYLSYKPILTSELQMVILGQKTPEQAAKDMEEQINRAFK
jgi:ABC-type glycerol-3-phosphate transport system substrate-binding protein